MNLLICKPRGKYFTQAKNRGYSSKKIDFNGAAGNRTLIETGLCFHNVTCYHYTTAPAIYQNIFNVYIYFIKDGESRLK